MSDHPPFHSRKNKFRTSNHPLPSTLPFYTTAMSSGTGGVSPTWKDRDSPREEGERYGIEATRHKDLNWPYIILPFLFPALGGFLYGFDIGATSGAAISLQSKELSGTSWFNFSSVQLGLVVSGSLYGAVAGSLLIYPIADQIGRKMELILAALLYMFSGLATAFAPSLTFLLFGRLLYGVSVGVAMHAAPLYIAETCPSQVRGTLISLKELFIVFGMLMGYLIGSFWINSVGGWRYMFGSSAPIALIMGLGMLTLPQSPRWLLLRAVQLESISQRQEYQDKATIALTRLRGRPRGDKKCEIEINDTFSSLKTVYADKDFHVSFFEVFRGPSLKAVIIGGGLVLFQQMSGQPSVLYYAASILQTAGFSAAADATQVSVYIGLFKLLMTGVAVLKVDDLGRKPLLIGGVTGIAVSLFCLSAYYRFLQQFPTIAVVSLLLCVSCYQISFGPISWLMVSEIFPLQTRGRGISLAVILNFGSHAIITFAFAPMRELLGAANLFLIFGVLTVFSLAFIILCVPETKGLSLEEIESKIFGGKKDREDSALV